jgi:hypothetical protein
MREIADDATSLQRAEERILHSFHLVIVARTHMAAALNETIQTRAPR